jgi:hypothetical protein
VASALQSELSYTDRTTGFSTHARGTAAGGNRMAEIHVEPRRRNLAWLWLILILVVLGGLAYYYLYS